MMMLKRFYEPLSRINLTVRVLGALSQRCYGTNPIEYRSKEELLGSSKGGGSGRGEKGRKRSKPKNTLRRFKSITFGEGKGGERWGGLSYPLSEVNKSNTEYGWLDTKYMGLQQESDSEKSKMDNSVYFNMLEGEKGDKRRISEMFWGRRGWTSKGLAGSYVGCPEMPDGTPRTDFTSYILELKRVTNMTRGGREKTVSALVVIGNRKGAVGFAVGKGDFPKTAIRKAKNKALTHLLYIPRYQDHTIYHNIKVKYCCTNVQFERRVRGTGLSCHRIITLICQLAGIKDARAKIIGSTNPLNIVRAAMKGLTSQVSHQNLADKSNRFVVEFSRETYHRPTVVAVPRSRDGPEMKAKLTAMQLL